LAQFGVEFTGTPGIIASGSCRIMMQSRECHVIDVDPNVAAPVGRVMFSVELIVVGRKS
jgi:hypothetical protein